MKTNDTLSMKKEIYDLLSALSETAALTRKGSKAYDSMQKTLDAALELRLVADVAYRDQTKLTISNIMCGLVRSQRIDLSKSVNRAFDDNNVMPVRFSSMDDLPTSKELADLSDEELFQEGDTP